MSCIYLKRALFDKKFGHGDICGIFVLLELVDQFFKTHSLRFDKNNNSQG